MQILLAILLLVALLPVLLLISLIQLVVFGKVFFIQQRLGKENVPFGIYKFQSMKPLIESVPEEERLNPWGRFLRFFSLDELPQLINVVRGEMAFIGPRPLLPQYQERYNSRQARRAEVKPGITGWAQVNGRNALAWNDQLELDVWYIENKNWKLDIKILFLTMKRMLTSSEEEVHLREEFKGEE